MSEPPEIRYLDHDADLGFEVCGPDRAAVWDLGARALVGVMTDVARVGTGHCVERTVTAPDWAAAWVASLAELLLAFEVDGLLLPTVEHLEAEETAGGVRVRFRARGEPYDPQLHPAETGIKAVTHHGAALWMDPDGRWHGRVLLDL